MDLISITIIYLFISMLFSAFMAITIFELRRYFGLSLTYAYLGLIYSMAILTASFLYHLSLIHISSPRDRQKSRMPSSA